MRSINVKARKECFIKQDIISANLKKKKFKPVYWLEGEEEFFIDQVIVLLLGFYQWIHVCQR